MSRKKTKHNSWEHMQKAPLWSTKPGQCPLACVKKPAWSGITPCRTNSLSGSGGEAWWSQVLYPGFPLSVPNQNPPTLIHWGNHLQPFKFKGDVLQQTISALWALKLVAARGTPWDHYFGLLFPVRPSLPSFCSWLISPNATALRPPHTHGYIYIYMYIHIYI